VIATIIKQCRAKGTTVILCGPQKQPQGILHKSHIVGGKDGVFYSPDYATSLKMAEEMATKESM
jgi:hypothetical protein